MRKDKPKKHVIHPDTRFNDPLVTQFVNNLMWQGKKSTAFAIFYDAIERIEKQTGENGYEIWKKALSNATPGVEVKSRRIGGANFQIPTEIRPDRKISLSIKWLIGYSRKRSGKSMAEKLAAEVMAAANNEGATIKKKEDVHKMAEANKAFAHFRA
jgi:small subunit ribosomal protein S7